MRNFPSARARRSAVVGLASAMIALVAAGPASVRAQSVRLDQYRMAHTPEDGFAVNRPNDLGHLRFGLRLDVDYALNPLVYRLRGSDPSTVVAPVVEHLLAAQVGVSFGLFDRLVVSAGVPVNALMEGSPIDGQPRADGTSLGDAYLGLRGRLFGEADDAFALSLQVTGTAPTANAARFQSRFAGEANFTIQPQLLVEVRIAEVIRITGNVGALVRERQDFGSLLVRSELTWALGLYASVVPRVLDLALESWGATGFDRFGDSQITPIEAVAGLRVRPVEGLHLGLAAGTGLARGYGAGDVRAIFSLGFATEGDRGPGDRDGDGIDDPSDRCPDEPEDRDGFADEDGCPDPDDDGDGIPDVDDRCPNEPEDLDGLADDDGCPEDDADGDGAPDATDRCPSVPGIALAPRPECTGCPSCDDAPPPSREPEAPALTPQTLPERVYFDTARARVRSSEEPALERVRGFLEQNPSAMVQVEGHADERGEPSTNTALSQRRARRVVEWLATRGVERSRLVGVGCGQRHPAETGSAAQGLQANRRVEFHVGLEGAGLRAGCSLAR